MFEVSVAFEVVSADEKPASHRYRGDTTYQGQQNVYGSEADEMDPPQTEEWNIVVWLQWEVDLELVLCDDGRKG